MIKRPYLILAVLCWLVTLSAAGCYVGVLGDETSKGGIGWIVMGLIFAVAGAFLYRHKDKPAS